MAAADVPALGVAAAVTRSVLHFSTSDVEGGSARSAWRIHTGLQARGIASRMLVGYKASDSADVNTVAGSRWLSRADNLASRVTARLGMQYCLIPSSLRLPRHPWVREADVIQIYNLHGGYFDLAVLPKLAQIAPLVWRLSDIWPLTGHCAYSGDCMRWQTGCGECPDLATYPSIGVDLTRWLWARKKRFYRQAGRIAVVAPSSWTEAAARQSPLFEGMPVTRIPNGINIGRFRSQDRAAARRRLGIADERPAILFNAHVAFNNPRKGSDWLAEVLRALPDPDSCCLIVAGRDSERWIGYTPVTAHPLGFVEADERLADLYAASDVVVIPSSVENLPNTALEALASARPIVALAAGGMADAVRDGETGFCLPVGDKAGFLSALSKLLSDPELRQRLGSAGRQLAECEFDEQREIDRFKRLYDTVTGRA